MNYLIKKCQKYPLITKLLLFLIVVVFITPSRGKYLFLSIILYISILFLYETLINKLFNNTFLRTFLHSFVYWIIFILGAFCFIYKKKFHVLNKADLFAIYQSNISESYQFIVVNNLLYPFLILAVMSYVLLFCICLLINKYLITQIINKKIIIFTVVFNVLNIIYLHSSLSNLTENDRFNGRYMGVIPTIFSSYDSYKEILAINNAIASNNNITLINDSRITTPELHVVIIGESSTSDHFSEYGYFFNNNANLHNILKSNSVKYSRAYSAFDRTDKVLHTILSAKSEGLINVLNKGKMNTYWLSNNGKNSLWSTSTTILTTASKTQFFATGGGDEDTLLPELENSLNNLDNNKKNIIFLHTRGSHSDVCTAIKHNSFKEKHEKLREKIQFYYGKEPIINSVEQISCYDQSIADIDEFILKVKVMAEKNPNFASLTYFSDHGEDIVTKTYHGNFNNKNYNQVRIPLIMIFSNKYIKNNPEIIKNIKKHKDNIVLNSFMFNTLQNIVGVKSANSYTAKLDMSSNEFNPTQADLDYGLKITNDPILKLNEKNIESKKYWVHRVNSLGKLYDVAKSNPNGVELDIIYKGGTLMVGHDVEHLSGGTLNEYMEHTDKLAIKNMWLDTKNINKNNIVAIKKQLDAIAKQYPYFKKHAFIETSYNGKEISLLINAGYTISYYLPTTELLELLKENNILKLKEEAKSINKQLKQQVIKNISFDARLYPFVTNYLEKEDNSLLYRVWPGNKNVNITNDLKVKVSLILFSYRFEKF